MDQKNSDKPTPAKKPDQNSSGQYSGWTMTA